MARQKDVRVIGAHDGDRMARGRGREFAATCNVDRGSSLRGQHAAGCVVLSVGRARARALLPHAVASRIAAITAFAAALNVVLMRSSKTD